MAINLLYRLVNQSPTLVEYEVLLDPDNPNEVPVRIGLSARGDEAPRCPQPMTRAVQAAIRKITYRRATEGQWPPGGLIQG